MKEKRTSEGLASARTISFTKDILSQDFKNKTEELKLFWLPEHLRSGGAGLPEAGKGESLSLS